MDELVNEYKRHIRREGPMCMVKGRRDGQTEIHKEGGEGGTDRGT